MASLAAAPPSALILRVRRTSLYTWSLWLLLAPGSLAEPVGAAMPSVELPGGGRMPMAGLGLCCRPAAHKPAVAQDIAEFIQLGGRHLDSSVNYGNSAFVGEAIRGAVSRGVPREEIFVTTKVEPEAFGSEVTQQVVGYALREMQLRYLDLVLLHQPASFSGEELQRCGTPRKCRKQAWQALEHLQSLGAIRHIGVSNFGVRHLEELTEYARQPIAVNQIEYHPWAPATHHAVLRWCHAHGVAVVAYASLGSPYTTYTRKTRPELPTTLDRIGNIASRLGRPWQQVVLRWAVQHNVTVIPGTSNVAHMKQNMDLFDWSLSDEDMAVMDSVPEAERGIVFSHFVLDAAPEGLNHSALNFSVDPARPSSWPFLGAGGAAAAAAVAIGCCYCWRCHSKRVKSA